MSRLRSLVQAAAPGQPAGRELLNSERIAAAFGSYGVEVLEQDEQVRVSNLYSGAAGRQDLPDVRDRALSAAPSIPRVSAEHAAIVAGGSIGAVFAAQRLGSPQDALELCRASGVARSWPR